MCGRVWNKYKQRRNERGVTLFVALLVVLFAAGYIVLNLNVNPNRIRDEKAAQTAWLIQEVAEAARLFVRDADANVGLAAPFNALFNVTALCNLPQIIAPVTLRNLRYLADNIGTLNGAGDLVTPFGQTIRIVAANSIIGTACTAPGLAGVAASAYIVLQPGANTTYGDLLAIGDALNSRGLSTLVPQFDAAGNNTSPDCGAVGTPGTLQWNTGCLTEAQYNTFGLGAFADNTIGLPAWLTFRGDNRAIFRFRQPENPQAQDMVTDLRMAPFTDVDGDGIQDVNPADGCAEVTIRTSNPTAGDPLATLNTDSGVCDSDDDDAGNNVRRNINNVTAIDSQRTIIETQAIDNNGAGPVGEAAAFNIQGTSTVTGDARVLGRNATAVQPSWVGQNLTVTAGSINVAPRAVNAAAPAANFTQNVNGNFLQADDATVTGNATINNITSVANELTLDNTNVTGTSGANGFLTNDLSGTVGNLAISGDSVVGGTTSVTGATTVNGTTGAPFSMATTSLIAGGTTALSNSLQVGGDVSVQNNAQINVINVGTCFGSDCPDRSPTPGSPL